MARRTHEEAQWDARIRREQEKEDLEAFIDAYEMATSLKLTEPERPNNGTEDFVCLRSGRTVGVELTTIRRPPPVEFLERLERSNGYNNEMSTIDGVDELGRLLIQKSAKIPHYSQRYNILLFINCECDFRVLLHSQHVCPTRTLANRALGKYGWAITGGYGQERIRQSICSVFIPNGFVSSRFGLAGMRSRMAEISN